MTRYIGKVQIEEYKEGITTIRKGNSPSYYSDIDVIPEGRKVSLWQGDRKISKLLPRNMAIKIAVELLS